MIFPSNEPTARFNTLSYGVFLFIAREDSRSLANHEPTLYKNRTKILLIIEIAFTFEICFKIQSRATDLLMSLLVKAHPSLAASQEELRNLLLEMFWNNLKC